MYKGNMNTQFTYVDANNSYVVARLFNEHNVLASHSFINHLIYTIKGESAVVVMVQPASPPPHPFILTVNDRKKEKLVHHVNRQKRAEPPGKPAHARTTRQK